VPYPIWISGIATQAGKRQSCLDIVGHTSATGPEPLNERLSLRRAEYVKNQIERGAPSLSERLITEGVGSRESMVGNGKDDASDALDRRVEFKVVDC
jgi:outer membrane protein OmpA-like peptidoglycan-associated protein